MSGLQRLFTYARENPVAVYIGGGVVLHLLRTFSVNSAYQQHFVRYDIERKHELEEYLASHPQQKQ